VSRQQAQKKICLDSVREIFNTSVWLQAGQYLALALAAQIPAKQKSGCPRLASGRACWKRGLGAAALAAWLSLLQLPTADGVVCCLLFGVFPLLAYFWPFWLLGVFRDEIPQSPSVWGISHGLFPK
jgi:hypothetical protein